MPKVAKERNELGLVVSLITIDESGHPINGETGMQKPHIYDEDSFASKKQWFDEGGQLF